MIIFLAGRIVIKYGTNALVEEHSVRLNKARIRGIASLVNELYSQGTETILVSSAAVAAGMELNGLAEKPKNNDEIKELGAEGQIYLMSEYVRAFAEYQIGVYQLLVSPHTFRSEKSRQEAMKRVDSSFKKRKVAIFNTNDALLSNFVDNDPLAADIASYCGAQSLIMVSESGNLGSGGGTSKEKALRMAKKQGIKTAVMTHAELEMIVYGNNRRLS